MAYQSIWYYSDLPEKVVDLIEEDLTEKFDPQMADSRLHGDALNKDKRNSQNAWIPTNHWLGGLCGIIFREQIERISFMI